MKVLHVWNTAGVASLMSKHLRLNGVDSTVIMRTGYDPFNMAEYYGDRLLNVSGGGFVNLALEEASGFDVVHIHGIYKMAQRLRELYPKKKIILQHHGTELSNCTDNKVRLHSYRFCDKVICSTSDLSDILTREGTPHELVDNAIDTDLFKPITSNKCVPALLFDIRYLDLEAVKKFIQRVSDWQYVIIDREYINVNYTEMPLLLGQYSRLIDVKCYEWTHGATGQAMSKTGREALACGLEVLDYRGETIKGLPEKYTPEFQVNQLLRIYNE